MVRLSCWKKENSEVFILVIPLSLTFQLEYISLEMFAFLSLSLPLPPLPLHGISVYLFTFLCMLVILSLILRTELLLLNMGTHTWTFLCHILLRISEPKITLKIVKLRKTIRNDRVFERLTQRGTNGIQLSGEFFHDYARTTRLATRNKHSPRLGDYKIKWKVIEWYR